MPGRPRKNGTRYPSGKLRHANGEPIDALMKWRRQREAVELEVIDRRGLGFTWPTKPRRTPATMSSRDAITVPDGRVGSRADLRTRVEGHPRISRSWRPRLSLRDR